MKKERERVWEWAKNKKKKRKTRSICVKSRGVLVCLNYIPKHDYLSIHVEHFIWSHEWHTDVRFFYVDMWRVYVNIRLDGKDSVSLLPGHCVCVCVCWRWPSERMKSKKRKNENKCDMQLQGVHLYTFWLEKQELNCMFGNGVQLNWFSGSQQTRRKSKCNLLR